MSNIRMSRAGRGKEILRLMEDSMWSLHTVNSVAKMMYLTPSTYLRGILSELVDEEKLIVSEFVDADGRVEKRHYALPHRMFTQLELKLKYVKEKGDD